MIKFRFDCKDYIVELPEGYTPEKRISFNRQERPGYYASNGNKRRWFPGRQVNNMAKDRRAKYA